MRLGWAAVLLAAGCARSLPPVAGAAFLEPETGLRLTLREGPAAFGDGPERGTATLVATLAVWRAPDGEREIAAHVAVNRGGSGTMSYVALFHEGANGLSHTSSVLIGDRVRVIAAAPGPANPDGERELEIRYLDRAPGEPMSARPTVERLITLRVRDHRLSE